MGKKISLCGIKDLAASDLCSHDQGSLEELQELRFALGETFKMIYQSNFYYDQDIFLRRLKLHFFFKQF